jgi:hypothetical protein
MILCPGESLPQNQPLRYYFFLLSVLGLPSRLGVAVAGKEDHIALVIIIAAPSRLTLRCARSR